jgi:hypothetical protein
MDWSLVFKSIATQGPWAILFVALLWWVMRESSRREDRLMNFLQLVGGKIEQICADLVDVKCDIHDIKTRRD